MRKKLIFKNVLYALAVLDVIYTGYTLFYSYDQVVSYYAAYGTSAPLSQIINNCLSSAFVPFMFAIVFYALACIVDTVTSIKEEFEVVAEDVPDAQESTKVSVQEVGVTSSQDKDTTTSQKKPSEADQTSETKDEKSPE